ncbi:hypothetical protein SAMN05660653_00979 [Desulfonatronum thiosulfatophilum]|uniref:Uncharacterized protein n=1 Tax=Desulfonatronum thiosulfatophilum TaxID=617002 RepID=A0A1G6BIY0_9BACT|nr:hypothetical protein [Desulfonatronum thiosulfatophilum]SDB20585.1 hypothetical protein SAMN05660653_00979 [Desulfonatronum thiosulfatophilum]
MQIQKFLIAGGNSTALVLECPSGRRKTLVADLLQEVEQVGFIMVDDSRSPRMEMMGGEFCINASLAFASTLGPQGWIKVSGLEQPVAYKNHGGTTVITVPISWSRQDNIILLQGIGFILLPSAQRPNMGKAFLADLCSRFSMPAFGAVLYAENRITPYVHVAAVDSFVPETACGSGSVAYSIFSGVNRVVQPSGGVIAVSQPGNQKGASNHSHFIIEAEVTSLTE